MTLTGCLKDLVNSGVSGTLKISEIYMGIYEIWKEKEKQLLFFVLFPYHTQNEKEKFFYFQIPEALCSESVGEGRTLDAFKARGLSSKVDHGDAQQSLILSSQRVGGFFIPKNIPEEQCKESSCLEPLRLREMNKWRKRCCSQEILGFNDTLPLIDTF